MIRFTFKKGLVFREVTKRWTLIRRTAAGKLQLEDEGGEIRVMTVDELYRAWLLNTMVIDQESLSFNPNYVYMATPRDLQTFKEKHRQRAEYRHMYMRKLVDGFTSTDAWIRAQVEKIAVEIGDKRPPAVSTIKRWWICFRDTQCVNTLVDKRIQNGRRSDNTVRALFEEAVNEIYLDPQKKSALDVYQALIGKCKSYSATGSTAELLRCPSRASVYRWLTELEQNVVDAARLGKREGDRKSRWVRGLARANHPLHRVEIDHTPLDVVVLDIVTRLPLGRPWLTVAIDRYSRVVLGFYISFRAPSAHSVLQCLKRAILPKLDWENVVPLRCSHLGYGIPFLIAVDNGMDLHAEAVQMVCGELGITMLYCPAGQPEFKGAVERMIGTIQRSVIHKLPGTVFSSIDERGDYPSEELAAIDLDTLTRILVKWIADEYHQTPHRGLQMMTPVEKWKAGLPDIQIELPAYPQQLEVITGIPETRPVWHYGIELDGVLYNNEQLQFLRNKCRERRLKVQLKRYEDDVSYVHVFDDDAKEYFKVSVVDRFASYAQKLTLHQHLLIKQRARQLHGDKWNDEHLICVKDEIQAMVSEAIQRKNRSGLKQAAAAALVDSEAVFASRHPTQHQQATSLIAVPDPHGAARTDHFEIDDFVELESCPSPLYEGVNRA